MNLLILVWPHAFGPMVGYLLEFRLVALTMVLARLLGPMSGRLLHVCQLQHLAMGGIHISDHQKCDTNITSRI